MRRDLDADVTTYWRLLDDLNNTPRSDYGGIRAARDAWSDFGEHFRLKHGYSAIHAHLHILGRGLRFEVYDEVQKDV